MTNDEMINGPLREAFAACVAREQEMVGRPQRHHRPPILAPPDHARPGKRRLKGKA